MVQLSHIYVYQFLSGLLVMGFAVCGTFFFKYWRVTCDRLFCWFAVAFWVLAIQRALVALFNPLRVSEISEHEIPFFLLRLVAYALIIVGIVDKNRSLGK